MSRPTLHGRVFDTLKSSQKNISAYVEIGPKNMSSQFDCSFEPKPPTKAMAVPSNYDAGTSNNDAATYKGWCEKVLVFIDAENFEDFEDFDDVNDAAAFESVSQVCGGFLPGFHL